MRSYLPLIIVSVSAGLILAAVLLSEDFQLNKDIFFAEEIDKVPTEKLHRISKAIEVVRLPFDKVENAILKHPVNPSATAEELKIITETTSDVDFMFAELDSIRGSSVVKSKRKDIAERLNELSARIDTLLTFLGKERA